MDGKSGNIVLLCSSEKQPAALGCQPTQTTDYYTLNYDLERKLRVHGARGTA
jgi:hypothetical protein